MSADDPQAAAAAASIAAPLSNPQQHGSQQQLYAVMIPVQNDTLLLPNLAIAEVVSREGLRAPAAGAPGWYAGQITWQNLELPVACFERMNGTVVEAPGRRARIVIVNSLSGGKDRGGHNTRDAEKLAAGRFGLLCEGYPHLVTLNRAAIRPAPLRGHDNAQLILTRARVASQDTAIPDLEFIERELARLLALAG